MGKLDKKMRGDLAGFGWRRATLAHRQRTIKNAIKDGLSLVTSGETDSIQVRNRV